MTLQPAATALLPQCGVPVVTVSPENVSVPLPVIRAVTSAKPPKYGKFVPPLLKVAVNVRCAATAWPFSVTLASTAAPEPPQYRYAATIDAPAGNSRQRLRARGADGARVAGVRLRAQRAAGRDEVDVAREACEARDRRLLRVARKANERERNRLRTTASSRDIDDVLMM